MELLLVPLIGPFHIRSPAYNGVTVRDIVAAWQPAEVGTSALAPGSLDSPAWRDTPEIALPLAVVPWLERRGKRLLTVGEAEPDPAASDDFRRYVEPYPALRRQLQEVEALLRPVAAELEKPLTVDRIEEKVVPPLREHQLALEHVFGDGPATGWLRERMRKVARRVAEAPAERLVLLTPVDHLPLLREELAQLGITSVPVPSVAATPEARERSVLDYAFRVDVPEPGPLIGQLREISGAEARYHEANLLLAGGHGYEALELLEKAVNGDFQQPYYLPGYLLARLGQLRDLADRRDDALRAYRGVLAMDYAPAEAVAAASEGLERPFEP